MSRQPLVTPGLVAAFAVHERVCIRPVLRTVTDTLTGDTTTVPIPCGSTRERACPSCAGKARRLRMHQCTEGWHLTDDPLHDHEDQAVNDHDLDDQADTDDSDEGSDMTSDQDEESSGRRCRSTRRRQDTPDLPRVPMADRTVGRTFTAANGRVYRPSMFLTLTLPSYGKVRDGVPVDPDTYDYRRAALDALLFPEVSHGLCKG